MSVAIARWDEQPWQPGGHPLERKKLGAARNVVLIEFAPGFEDPNACERGHVLYVLEGTLEMQLADSVVTICSGQCATVDRGTVHRARNSGDEWVVVFVVTDE